MISANPAKATTPTRRSVVWRSMNRDAAACATSSRLGAMSVAHMLRETSIAKITVAWPVGHRGDDHRSRERQGEAREPHGEQREREVPADP